MKGRDPAHGLDIRASLGEKESETHLTKGIQRVYLRLSEADRDITADRNCDMNGKLTARSIHEKVKRHILGEEARHIALSEIFIPDKGWVVTPSRIVYPEQTVGTVAEIQIQLATRGINLIRLGVSTYERDGREKPISAEFLVKELVEAG